jgi:adenosylcobyric acid synthase
MMGKSIRDPDRVESESADEPGLGLLDMETTFYREKTTTQVQARTMGVPFSPETKISGYEIHMGNSVLGKSASPAFEIISRNNKTAQTTDGAVDGQGRTLGTYIHGIFDNDNFRKNFIQHLRKRKGLSPLNHTGPSNTEAKEQAFDRLAKIVRESLDMKQLYRILQQGLN